MWQSHLAEIHPLSSKYKDFDLEIVRMWKRKTDETSRYWALGVIKEGQKNYVERILAVEKSGVFDAYAPIL